MANEEQQRIAPPIPFLTAVWAGMSHEDILAGLRNGDIVRPGRLPDWAAELDAPEVAAASNHETVAADRARVSAWFTSLDPDLSASAFDAIWNKAGASDGERAAKLTSYLSSALLAPGSAGAREDALDDYLADGAHHAKIVDLSGKTGEQLAALGKTDIGYRQALAHMQPFAITGTADALAAANGDIASDEGGAGSGEPAVSDAWLADRGKFLAWKLSDDAGQSMAISGTQDWTFIDRSIRGADGQPLKLEIKTGAVDAGKNQVVFGTGDDEVFKGVAGSDRIYAGAGDDVLRGAAGGDYLEGGDGDDLAMGGAGNDELLGERGDDELDGGGGDDRLEGGSGNDTYVVDAGDGADTIVDTDGLGTIELDGEALRGRMREADGKWTSADANVEFTFDGDLNAGGTLTIASFAEGASHDGAPQNTITVNDWKNGDLGITLGGDVAADSVAPESDTQAPVTSTADLDSETWEDQGALSLDGSGNVTSAAAATEAMQPVADNASAQAPSHDGEGAIDPSFDFDAALDSLLGNSDPTFNAVDPTAYQQAVEAFSGVLVPPDVSAGSNVGDAADIGAVTEAAMADALAADYASDAFDNYEPTHAQALPNVDVASLMELKKAGVGVHPESR